MVKRGGTKRKAEIRKIIDKNSKAVTFSKRRDGLFSKAAQLCVLRDAQIAILATPSSSSNSNVSFFSFGHSSVDSVVSAFLSGQKTVHVPEESKEMKELGLGYWLEDEKLASKSPEEIIKAMESMKILLRDAERLLDEDATGFNQRESSLLVEDEKKDDNNDDVVLHHHHGGTGKTLIDVDDDLLPQTLITTIEWSDMDLDLLLSDDKTEEKHHQIVAVSENSCNNNNALLLPAAIGGLNDGNDQNLINVDIADLDLDAIFEGLANLDDEYLASIFSM
ncbi:hypothetical protein N665_0381s0022 [Sinapis alba]|nr:hypothetical protein N665_0381s0022 [Sinapis alba]